MTKTQYTVSPFWDSRVMNAKTKESRIMLTIYLNRQQFRVSIKLSSTKEDFNKALSGRSLNDVQKGLKKEINYYVDKAETLLERMVDPTKDAFMRLFKSEADFSIPDKTNALPFFKLWYDKLLSESRFGSSHNVRCAWYAFKNYMLWLKDGLTVEQREVLKKGTKYVEPSIELPFEDIDEKYLKDFRSYMINQGRSETTIGIYTRCLRTLYNNAVKDGLIANNNNPFAKVKIGWNVRSKAVLYPEHLELLWNYKPDGLRESRAKSFFFFCYLCSGMNFKDVAFLKGKNLKGNVLTFVRQKTKTTTKHTKEIKVHLHVEAKQILNEIGTPNCKPDEYLFPWFNGCKDAAHHNATYVRHKKVTNKSLIAIGKKLEFDVRLTIGLARHSYATKQKLDGTPVAFISESMGHSRTEVTEHYLKSLPDENLRQLSANLLKFK